MKRGLWLTLMVIVAIASVAWWNRIEIALTAINLVSAPDVAPHRAVNWQQDLTDKSAASDGATRPPNVILILADDLGYNDISTFGGGVADGQVQTPAIDQLAAEGVVFEQSYSGTATCAPSRAMLLTGRYPSRTGFEFTPTPAGLRPIARMVRESLDYSHPVSDRHIEVTKEIPPFEQQGLPSSEVTIAEMLKARGYYTAHIGKWHLGRSEGFTPNDQGFDDSLLMESGLYLPIDDPNVVNARVNSDPMDRFVWEGMHFAASFNNEGAFEPGGYLTDYWTDEAIKVIQANKNRPFFLYLAHWGVHAPLQATREDYEAVGNIKPHRLRVYAAMIRALDRSVARINDTLEAEGLADNTIVIFSSDNGGAGYLGLPKVNAPFRGWKVTNFEGGLRVPLFIKWPEQIEAGQKVGTPVAHIDLLPTLAAATGSALPKDVEIDGENLMPLATHSFGGVSADEWRRETLFWQSGHYRVVRHGDWKLQVSEHPAKTWLYNLAIDPTEQHNLSAQAPEKLAELQALLANHQANATRQPLYPYQGEMGVAVDKTLAEKFEEGDEYIFWPN